MAIVKKSKNKVYVPAPGEPAGWRDWKAVAAAPIEITKVCPQITEDIYLYSDTLDRYGFLTKEKILTASLFAKHVKPVAREMGIFAATMAGVAGINNWALVDLKNNKIILKEFACYFLVSETHLAYRVDDMARAWPSNMDWGVIEIPSGKEVMAPKTFIPDMDDKKYIPIRERILKALTA